MIFLSPASWFSTLRTVLHPFSRLAHGFLWTSLGNISAQVLGLLGGILAARWLGKSQFGELSLIKSTVLMLGVFAGSGFSVTVAKYVSEHRDREPERCGEVIAFVSKIAIGLGLIVVGASAVFASEIVLYAVGTKNLALAFQLAAFLALLNILSGIQQGVLVGLESFRALSILVAVEASITLAGTAIGASHGVLIECLTGIAAAAVLNVALRGWVTRTRIRDNGISVRWREKCTDRSLLWKFALPSVLLGLLVWPFEWLSRVFIARTPIGMEELGKFAAAYSWGALVLFLPTQIASPSLPILSNLYGKRDRKGFLRTARMILVLALILGMTVALTLAVFSTFIVHLYGDAFGDARGALLILLAAYSLSTVTVLGSIFAACGRMWWQVLHYGAWGLTLAAGAFMWRAYGAEGLAGSYVAAYLALVICQATFAFRLLSETRTATV